MRSIPLLLGLFLSVSVWGESVVYTFNTDAGIAALGISKPSTGNGTDLVGPYSISPVSMAVTHASTSTRVYNSSGTLDLRIYKNGGSFTFSVDAGYYLTSVVFTGNAIGSFSVDAGSSGTFSAGTWTAANTSTTSVKLNATNTGKINTITVNYESTGGGGCDKNVNITKGTPVHGDFTLSIDGEQATCDGNVQVVVTPTPAEHYKVTGVSAPNSSNISGPDGDGKYTVTYAQNTNADSEINVTFALKDQYTVTWNNHGLTSTSQVYEGEKPKFPETPTSCDATSTTFIGWATAAWNGKVGNIDDKTVYTSAAAMPAVEAEGTVYYAVYAKASAGDEEEHDGPSFSRSGSDDTYTTGYTFSAQAEGKTGYYQDGSGTLRYIQVLNATTPIFSETPNRVTVTAKIGGGTGNTDLTDPVQAQLLDNTGAPITGAVVAITSHITTNTGDTYAEIEIPITGVTSAYGVRISHQKQSGYNVRYYSFSLKYYTGGATYSDYMTTCAAAGTCEAPSFTPAAGTFDGAQDIVLQSSTPSSHIYYTLDGTDPDDNSDEYSTPIHITQNTTIKAITYADGLTKSSISTGEFNIRYAQPTLTPSAEPVDGKYTSAITVTLTADEADAIYYAIGEVPTIDNEHLYSTPIVLKTTGSKTVNAIAVKDGYANSNVASATYVMDLPYGSIAEFIAGAPATAKSLTLNNAIITGVDGTTLYIQDETAGIMIYGLSSLPENAAPNHRISGTIVGKYSAYHNQHELVKPNNTTPIDMSGVTISADEVARPAISEYTSLSDAYAAKPMMLVTLKGVNYDGTQYEFDGNKIYNTFGALTGKTMPETTVDCDITGIVIKYYETLELLPVFASDIVADADAAAPVFSPTGGADAENAVMVDFNSDVTISAADANHTVDITTARINTTDPMSVTSTSSRDFYRPTSVTKWYKGNPASITYDINGLGDLTGGSVTAQVSGADAAVAAKDAVVTLSVDVAAHYTFTSISVVDADESPITLTEVTAGEEYTFPMPAKAVTVSVVFTEDTKYALTFTAGEGSGNAPAISGNEYYAGDVIPLPANTFTYDAQHKFTKWLIGGTEYAAGASYTMPAAPTEAVAQWKTIPNFASGDWILVKDAAELTEGSYVIIASAEVNEAMKPYAGGSDKNCKTEEAAIDNGLLTYNNVFAVYEIREGNKINTFALQDISSDYYLYAASSSSNDMKTEETLTDNSSWTASITSTGDATLVAQGSNTRNVMHYNPNGTNPSVFSCYANNSSVTGLVTLYKYHTPSLKLSYDKNTTDAVTNLPGMQIADGENKVTVSSKVPLRENYIFNGWKDVANNDYVAGNEITLSANMTLYAQWRTPNTYSISYDANGGALIEGESEITPNPTSVTEGNAYTVEENVYEKEGKLFLGWKSGDVTYNAGQIINPTENMAFVAQWGDPTVTDFRLVTDASHLLAGDKVYIVAAESGKESGNAMGTQNGTYRNRVEVSKRNDFIVNIGNEPVEFTVGKSGDDFTFFDGENYIAWSSGNSLENASNVTNNSTWVVTINEGVATIANKADGTRKLQYNSSSPRFAAYTSSQKAVSIYKKANYTRSENIDPAYYGTICLPKAGVFVGGALYEVAYYDGTKVFFDEVLDGQMEAGMPYIFLADGNEIKVYYTSDAEATAQNKNGLYGTLENMTNMSEDGIYMIYRNQILHSTNSGSYLNANRAYLKIGVAGGVPTQSSPAPMGRRRISMSVQGTNTATGVENIQPSESSIQKVLINGQLFIIRGEKMYNANGQLVK